MLGKIKVIYKGKNYLVVDKPSGMITTKEKKGELGTLEDWVAENFPNNLPRNGIMHRLDKGTSGLVLIARNEKMWLFLKKQFKDRLVVKKYYCLVGGETSADGSINWPIARSRHSFGKFEVRVEGKEALTEFKLIKRYCRGQKKYSFLEINLKTGRTHQIRVHLSYLRWPLVGDRVYGGETEILKRPFLHAFWLEFNNREKQVKYISELADDLKEHLKQYEEG
ncbi:MAG TPA: RNA pseudouridine synthase [Candidatus Woesebacteria bacterium]|jgi:23S rRNA pseudouridine1911/1915/1917 synthase|nr:RNA pseudouridine synthase [Candidatus Shapirobacteria bacterium]HOR02172.1 RNA pseudouridine synthase [Candidatus Woesebacteria bacterium]